MNENDFEKSNLPIFKQYSEFLEYSMQILAKYPKSEKFALVTEMKNCIYTGLRELMYAIKKFDKNEKVVHISEMKISMAIFKILVRNSYKWKYINIRNYGTWFSKIMEIENSIGKWANSCQRR